MRIAVCDDDETAVSFLRELIEKMCIRDRNIPFRTGQVSL